MTKIRIVTDSTADIPKEVYEKLGIEVIPLKVHFGEETFLDGVTIKPPEFYEKLQQSESLPTTSQPSPVDFLDVYKKVIKEESDAHILSVHLSAALSGTYQSAVLAKSLLEEEANITIVDTKSASYGTGHIAVSLAKAVMEGSSIEDCLKLTEQIRSTMGLYFVVDTLEFLQKGGRIGKAAAVVGSLLNIKPILTVDEEGEVASVDKVRGQKKAMDRIVQHLSKKFSPDQEVTVNIPHTNAEEYANLLSEKLKQHFNVKDLTYTTIGPVVGTHVGPGTVAVMMSPAQFG